MHHYRISLSGPARAAEAAAADLIRAGARPSARDRLVLAAAQEHDDWQALSRRHPKVVFGVEYFEALDGEFVHLVVENGQSTEMARGCVLPAEFGSFHDEDGEPLNEDLLRAAAGLIDAQRLQHDVGELAGGLDVAVVIGKAIGRLCCLIEPLEEPSNDALEAVVELGVIALLVSESAGGVEPAEREFEHALILTRSVVHAGRSEFFDAPGEADWTEWAQTLIWSASDVLDAACHWWPRLDSELTAVGAEHFGTAAEQVETAARSLLTTCVEVLALFSAPRSPPVE